MAIEWGSTYMPGPMLVGPRTRPVTDLQTSNELHVICSTAIPQKEKKRNNAICSNMDGPRVYYA